MTIWLTKINKQNSIIKMVWQWSCGRAVRGSVGGAEGHGQQKECSVLLLFRGLFCGIKWFYVGALLPTSSTRYLFPSSCSPSSRISENTLALNAFPNANSLPQHSDTVAHISNHLIFIHFVCLVPFEWNQWLFLLLASFKLNFYCFWLFDFTTKLEIKCTFLTFYWRFDT